MPLSIPELHEAAIDYSFQRGLLMSILPWQQVRADPSIGQQIAREYEAAPRFDEAVVPSFQALRKETLPQFDWITRPVARGGLGIKVLVQTEEPYRSVEELVADLCEERTLRVYGDKAVSHRHPFLTADERHMLLAVFAAFGHAAIQVAFDADGEEAAWLRHSMMFSPLARRAMTTETRGRTCALRYASKGIVVEPKVMLLPSVFSMPNYDEWR